MTDFEKLMKGLDLQNPSWAFQLADQADLRDFAYDCTTLSSRSRQTIAFDRLRTRVAGKLMIVVRAALDAELVVMKKD